MKAIRCACAIVIGKSAAFLVKLLRLGSGSVMAGHLAKRLYPDIFSHLCRQAKYVIYISGTNGKTTTTHLLSSMLGNSIYNPTGANLESGLTAALIKESRWGKLLKENIVLEVDEKVLPTIVKKHPPNLVICLNLFRDQLDRHGEVDLIRSSWQQTLSQLSSRTRFLFNGDDPSLVKLGESLSHSVTYFGLNEPERGTSRFSHAADSIYCPTCKIRLKYRTTYFSHLGDFYCPTCSFSQKDAHLDSREWPSISPHLYAKYNTMAAATTADICGIEKSVVLKKIKTFSPAFGRGEKIKFKGRDVVFLLSKNAVSLNQSLSVASECATQKRLGALLIALNDKDADGNDVSWIWDADLEHVCSITDQVVVTGSRAYEMALCLDYMCAPSVDVGENLECQTFRAIDICEKGKTLCVIATYTAMLELRKILIGRKIL